MDKKQAMARLGLTGNVSMQDVRGAYRRLAKQHHPDHFARDRNGCLQAESRMKAINQAYQVLKAALPIEAPVCHTAADTATAASANAETDPAVAASGRKGGTADRSPRPPKNKPRSRFTERRRRSGVIRLVTELAQWVVERRRRRVRRGPGPHRFRPGPAPGGGINRVPHASATFEQVLSKQRPVRPSSDMRPPSRQPNRSGPYANFMAYMAVKQQVDARKRRRNHESGGRVEKITPVHRVGRVDGR